MTKSAFLRNCFAFTLLLIFSLNVKAQVNWVGVTSTDWATGSNWSSGVVPGASDNVQIGVVHFNFQPTLSANTSVRNLAFSGNVPVILTIQVNDTLRVINKIVQNHSGDGLAPSTLITGAGAISCASVMVGDLTSPRFVQSKTSTLASKINAFIITGNIDLNSVTENLLTGGVANNNSFFSLQGGILSLGGKINTISMLPQNCNSFGTNNPNAKFSIDINSNQDAVLKLTDSSAVNISNPNYATVDFYNHLSDTGRSRVEYIGANQLVYTNTVAGVDVTPSNYQDLTIAGTGAKTAGTDSTNNELNISGNLLISSNSAILDLKKYAPQTIVAANFRNRGTVNFGTGTTTINGASFFNSGGFNAGIGVIQFSGAAQSFVDSTLNGTNFRRVGFYHNGIKAIQSGKFAVVPNGKVRLADTANLNVVTGAIFIIRADSTGSASIAALLNGCTVTGQVVVEQFIAGSQYLQNSSARGYKYLTSPVNFTGTLSGNRDYNINFLKGTNDYNGFLTLGLSGGGFTIDGIPSTYIWREDISSCNGSNTCGQNKPFTKINYDDPNLIGTTQRFTTSNTVDTAVTLPIGTGLIHFYRGNKVINNGTTTGSKTVQPLNWPENVTLDHVGTANQGIVQFRDWFRSDYYLSYTNSPSISNSNRGFNRFGNPYPAAINWDNFSATDSTSSLYGPNTTSSVYLYNMATAQFNAYQPDPTHDKTQVYYGTGVATNIVKIGQAFDIQVDGTSANPYAARLQIRETAKFDPDASSWPSVSSLSMGFAFAQNQSSNRGINRPLSLAVTLEKSTSGLNPNKTTGNKASTKNTLHAAANLGNRKTVPTSAPDQFFRLRLVQDTSNYDDILIRFSSGAKDKYNPKEDAFDMGGTEEATTMLSSYSGDHIPLAINKLPFPVHSKNILLFTDAKESGAYHLKASDLQNIPSNYNIRLKDKLTGAIINLRLTDHYDFNIDKNIAASFGDRFEVIITNGH